MKRDFYSNPYTTEEVNTQLNKVNIKLVDDYVNKTANSIIKFGCLLCGHIWEGRYAKVKEYKCCPACRQKYTAPKYGSGTLSANGRIYVRNKARLLVLIKHKGCNCEDCGCDVFTDHWKAEFHHIDPMLKENPISTMINSCWHRIYEEVDKCKLLCSSCHSKIHYSDIERFNQYKDIIYDIMNKIENGELS